MNKIAGVILAAGQGTRMHSNVPKVLHPLLGKSMVLYPIQKISQVTQSTVLVLGHEAHTVLQNIQGDFDYVIQQPQLGTGHALHQTEKLLRGKVEKILVTMGDMPLIQVETLQALISMSNQSNSVVTLLTFISQNPRGFGRIIRDRGGNVQAIVEEAEATPEQQDIQELNAGVYCFDAEWLWSALPRIPLSSKNEYYLTDVVALANQDKLHISSHLLKDNEEVIGVNNRIHLAEAEGIMRKRVNEQLMLSGVTILDPSNTYIMEDVAVGRDTVIWPNTYLLGKTEIGEACVIGPNAYIRDSQIGDNCKILVSVIEQAKVESNVDIGPFAHLRKGAHLGEGVHMGNFGEVKNAYLGAGAKMGHFSYIGDATIGENVNIGAGTITCNYDGKIKNHTKIGEGAFIGSDTMLVAPVEIGKGARTGAGAVVTKNVPPHTLAVGVPARNIRKLDKRD